MRVAQELERLFERSDDPVLLLDPANDRILRANRAACRMLGFTRDELLATPISHVHPAEMPQLLDIVEHVLRNGHGSTTTLTCRTKCGDFLPAEMALFALAGGGETPLVALVSGVHPRILGLIHDRSEHRQRNPG